MPYSGLVRLREFHLLWCLRGWGDGWFGGFLGELFMSGLTIRPGGQAQPACNKPDKTHIGDDQDDDSLHKILYRHAEQKT